MLLKDYHGPSVSRIYNLCSKSCGCGYYYRNRFDTYWVKAHTGARGGGWAYNSDCKAKVLTYNYEYYRQ